MKIVILYIISQFPRHLLQPQKTNHLHFIHSVYLVMKLKPQYKEQLIK